jgi:PAS domain S-box-containing protein
MPNTNIAAPDWLRQMEGILETLNEGVVIADDRQRILFANECMERLTQRPRSALIGRTPDAFYQGEDLERIQQQGALGLARGENRYESFLPRPDGTRVPVIFGSRNLKDPEGHQISVITCTDITEQKTAEQSLREANAQLERRAEEINRDLALASRVQQSLAPHAFQWGRWAVETHYMPVSTIGGDFGLVLPHDPGHLDLLVCDVSGHGISSALLANRIYTETVSLLRQGTEPGELVRILNRFMIEQIGGGSGLMFTMAAARVDQRGRQLTYAAAGHPPGLLIYSPGKLHQLESRSTILGEMEDAVSEKASEIFTLATGDRLMLYSDGLYEVWNREGEMLGIEGLERIVCSAAGLPLPAMRQAIIEGVNSYSAGPVHDDVTLVLAEVR